MSAEQAATEGPEPTLEPRPPGERVGFALVGLGHLTVGQLLPAFAETKGCRPVALVTGDRSKGERIARQYGIEAAAVYGYGDYDRIGDNPDIQVAFVVLPNAMHADFVIRAARAGKHVLVEKPMATSVLECQAMIAACRAASRHLMVAYRIQYDPHHRLLRDLIHQGRLGTVRHALLYFGQNQGAAGQWRLDHSLSGGGALPDIGLYCLNTIRFLIGEEPVAVAASLYAPTGDPRFTSVEESVEWTLRFPGGVSAVCGTSYSVHRSDVYRVMGTEGWAEMSPAFSYRGLALRTSRRSADDPRTESVETIRLPDANQFALEMDHMAECVGTGRRPQTPGEEGLQDQRIMDAIYASARSGRTVGLTARPEP